MVVDEASNIKEAKSIQMSLDHYAGFGHGFNSSGGNKAAFAGRKQCID